jgi:hypothetical protein
MTLLDQLTQERDRWRASLAVPFARAIDGAAPAPRPVSSVVRDQLQSAADARLLELDALIRNVEDALHQQTAHFDDVVAATRRQRIVQSPAERMLRRRAGGDEGWAHAMYEVSRLLPAGMPTSPRAHAAMSLHGAWLAWLLADTANGTTLASIAVVPKGPRFDVLLDARGRFSPERSTRTAGRRPAQRHAHHESRRARAAVRRQRGGRHRVARRRRARGIVAANASPRTCN